MSKAPSEILSAAQVVWAYLEALEGPPPPIPDPPPRPGHYVTEDPPYSATCWATMFGLTWHGLKDPGDNQEGFFVSPSTGKEYDTSQKTLVGCSLPREVLLSTFNITDEWRTSHIDSVWHAHAHLVQDFVSNVKPLLCVDSGGHTIPIAPLVDAGPTAETGNGLDLTYAAAHALDTMGKALCTYKILVNGAAIPIRGWLFDKRRVG